MDDGDDWEAQLDSELAALEAEEEKKKEAAAKSKRDGPPQPTAEAAPAPAPARAPAPVLKLDTAGALNTHGKLLQTKLNDSKSRKMASQAYLRFMTIVMGACAKKMTATQLATMVKNTQEVSTKRDRETRIDNAKKTTDSWQDDFIDRLGDDEEEEEESEEAEEYTEDYDD
eukprot:GHVU01225600.1.p1 GENE.GHVU01225600.1~~GHVU01225600.1.p1  ORF type:complete len:171 (+),score=50.28 GHVU01225600.1:73-585(+)